MILLASYVALLLPLAAMIAAIAWHVRTGVARDGERDDVRSVRRGSLVSALGILLVAGDCSATGLRTSSGLGYQLVLNDPAAYLPAALVLVGPLLAVLLLPALLTVGGVSPRRATLMVVACWLGVIAALATTYAGFATSIAVFCAGPPTAAEGATCAASTGALAGIWGVLGPVATLPFAVGLGRRRRAPPPG
jgi:quinol-cytochrome oxidoreductase complex cytochrome b subunit